MRAAFLSDVHSNHQALSAVLEHAAEQGVDRLYCLGDIVGYNAHPNECIELLRKAEVAALQGNHDWAATVGTSEGFNAYAVAGVDYARRALSAPNRAWLQSLPFELQTTLGDCKLAMYHGSPRDPLMEYVFPSTRPDERTALLRAAGSPNVLVLGHTHVPMRLEHDGALLINPGSVGQPRDGDPRTSYAILDSSDRATQFHRLDYDVEAAARAVQEAGLPEFLWQRLLRGV